MYTDAPSMTGPADRSTEELRAELRKAESRLDSGSTEGFSTALTDDDRRYLDISAWLYARETAEEPCTGESEKEGQD